MRNNPSPDSGVITLSTLTYRLLLIFYPIRFRRAYGPHMAQVFRDCCLKTYRQAGLTGMGWLWAYTLFDWVKTVLEEQLQRGTAMTQSKLIRLSGWGMSVGALALMLGFMVDATTIYVGMMRTLGPPDTVRGYNLYNKISENVGGGLALAGVLLLVGGAAGLRLRYGKRVGSGGNAGLLFSMVGGGMTAGGMLGAAWIAWDGWWSLFMCAMAVQFAGLALFGIAALRTKPMPRGNGVPLLAGCGFPVLAGIYLLFRGPDNVLEMPVWVTQGMWLISLVGFTLLGYILQADAPPEEAAA